jgi:biotin transport system ATP-binding protein
LSGRRVLEPLALTLAERRIGIVGRNGSGKTTLLRLIAGLVAPASGGVRMGEVDPFADRRGALSAVGILFQNPDHQILFPTVEEELAFGLTQQGRSRREALAEAHRALAEAGRAHWASAAVSTLSGGQRQFLCLLSVLLMRPQTLLLDEPFSGLDLPSIRRMERRLAGLSQRLITISHDPAALLGTERVIWLEAGTVRADGPAARVLAEYRAEMERLGAEDADADLAG